jgi:hypothetical protein
VKVGQASCLSSFFEFCVKLVTVIESKGWREANQFFFVGARHAVPVR